MEKEIKITSIIAITAIVLVGIVLFAQNSSSETISVTGEYSLNVLPDKVGIYLNVETSAKTLEEATEKNANITSTLTEALLKEGLAKEEIQTQNYYSYQDFDWSSGARIDRGYKVIHSIKIQLSADNDNIGGIIDSAVNAGAMVSYINYELSSAYESQYKAEAIQLATEDAKAKAEAIAEGLDKKVGKVVSISDSSIDYYPLRAYDVASSEISLKDAATNLTPSEQTVYARISAVFKIN